MYSNSQGFHQGSLFQTHIVRQLETEISSLSIPSAKVAIIWWSCTKFHIRAQIVSAMFAIATHSARNTGFNCYAISSLQVFNILTASAMLSLVSTWMGDHLGRNTGCCWRIITLFSDSTQTPHLNLRNRRYPSVFGYFELQA